MSKLGREVSGVSLFKMPVNPAGGLYTTAQSVSALVCDHLSAVACSIWLVDNSRQALSLFCCHPSLDVERAAVKSSLIDSAGPFRLLGLQSAVAIESLHDHFANTQIIPLLVVPDVGSVMLCGIAVDGQWQGLMVIESQQQRVWSDEEQQWSIQLAEQMALAYVNQRQLEHQSQLSVLHHAIEQSNKRVLIAEADSGTIVYLNRAYLKTSDRSVDRLLGASITESLLFRQAPKQAQQMMSELHSSGRSRGEARLANMQGEPFWIEYSAQRISTQDEQVFWVITSEDVSERYQHQAELERLAWYCSLTGLHNRDFFQRQLSSAAPAVLLTINLTGFKGFNNLYGHDNGDHLLKAVATRLRQGCDDVQPDLVARIGADEFAVGFAQPPIQGLRALASLWLDRLRRPVRIDGRQYPVRVAMAAVVTETLEGHLDVMAALDLAMAKAKQGRGLQIFDQHLLKAFCRRNQIRQDLLAALPKGEFELHYQPLVSMRGAKVLGAEALLRWHHPTLGMLMPGRFIEVAETTGQIEAIGLWVLETALKQLDKWQRRWPDLEMHINVSAQQLLSSELLENCWSQLSSYRVKSGSLVLEITETSLMEDIETVSRLCEQLGELGIVLAIDDFGVGYSSMRYIQQLPVAKVKIDRSFVADLETSKENREIVPAIIAMGQALELTLTAEGVETEAQQDFLDAAGCHQAQGYLFGKPMSQRDFESLLNRQLYC